MNESREIVEDKQTKCLVLAGGVPQIELLKQLESRGIFTILADGNDYCVAKEYADEFYCIDIFDVEAVKNIAIMNKVDFVMTVCADQVLLVVADVSEQLGLPCYIDLTTAKNVSNKVLMKKIFKKIGIPTTGFVEMKSLDIEKTSNFDYPMVVKPVDAYSSKGVRKAFNEKELREYYYEAQRISRSGNVIIEEYFEGEEISVDAFVVDGRAQILSITNSEKVIDNNRFVIFRGKYPARISDIVVRKIEEIVQKIADGFDLKSSPLLVQLLHRDNSVSVLEFCARTGGNMKWILIKNSCGVDVISATIDITLGIAPNLKISKSRNQIVVNDFIYCYPGVFNHIEGVDELVEQGFINEFYIVRPKGTKIYGVSSSSDRVAGMNIIAGNIAEFNMKEQVILERLRVVDSLGKDIMRKDLFTKLV